MKPGGKSQLRVRERAGCHSGQLGLELRQRLQEAVQDRLQAGHIQGGSNWGMCPLTPALHVPVTSGSNTPYSRPARANTRKPFVYKGTVHF